MPEASRYEYVVLPGNESGTELAATINALAQDGWEPFSIAGGLRGVHVLLRRLRAEPEAT